MCYILVEGKQTVSPLPLLLFASGDPDPGLNPGGVAIFFHSWDELSFCFNLSNGQVLRANKGMMMMMKKNQVS